MVGRRDLYDIRRVLIISGHILTFERFTFVLKTIQQLRAVFIPILEPLALYAVALGGIQGLYKYAFFSIAGILMSQHAIYFLPREEKILEIIKDFKALLGRRSQKWHIDIFNEESTPLWWIINLYLVTCAVFISFHSIAPIVVDFFLAIFTDFKPFSLPTPAEPYLGENPQRSLSYYLMYTAGSLWSGFLTWHSLGTECMCYVFVTYLCVELRIIGRNIQTLGEMYSERKGEDYKAKLREIVKDHQDIIRLSSKVNDLLGPPLVFQNVVSTMTITLLMFTANVNIRSGNYPVAFGACFPLNCFLWMIFAICYMGQKLQGNSLILSENLYELPWYEMDVEMRKNLIMMIRQTSRPLVIDFKKSSAISLITFQKLINESYSYLMVLQSMQ